MPKPTKRVSKRTKGPTKRLVADPIVDALMPDPNGTSTAIPLVGFLGRSPSAGHWRLYLSLAFTEYVEFREADVIDSFRSHRSNPQIGGTIVWLRKQATVRHTRTVVGTALSESLRTGRAKLLANLRRTHPPATRGPRRRMREIPEPLPDTRDIPCTSVDCLTYERVCSDWECTIGNCSDDCLASWEGNCVSVDYECPPPDVPIDDD
jgi:hypothetical protein